MSKDFEKSDFGLVFVHAKSRFSNDASSMYICREYLGKQICQSGMAGKQDNNDGEQPAVVQAKA